MLAVLIFSALKIPAAFTRLVILNIHSDQKQQGLPLCPAVACLDRVNRNHRLEITLVKPQRVPCDICFIDIRDIYGDKHAGYWAYFHSMSTCSEVIPICQLVALRRRAVTAYLRFR